MKQPPLTTGIDEAGRGPILGPMIIACVSISEEAATELKKLGIQDSKKFGSGHKAHTKRCQLLSAIYTYAQHVSYTIIDVGLIDHYTHQGKLNLLEQEQALTLLQKAPASQNIIADGYKIFSPLQKHFSHLQAVNHGESYHPAVAAASMIAKAKRDELWLDIVKRYKDEFGDLIGPGWGYFNLPTKKFLFAYHRKYGQPPPEGRKSWPWDFLHLK